MKLGVSSYSFKGYMEATGQGYLALCDLAKEIGFDGIEFIDLEPKYADGQPAEEAARAIRRHCEQIGLEIPAYTVGADFIGGSGGDQQKEVARVKALVDVAEILGAKVLRHDATWQQTGPNLKTYRDAIARVAGPIREVTEYAQGKGIKTCTENHGYLIQDSYRVEELIRTVNHENYGWLVDMGNFCCADEESTHAVDVAAPYAVHVHAKDFLIKPGRELDPGEGWFKSRGGNYLRGTVVGHGQIPVAQCVNLLKARGYDGYLSLEFEGMEEPLAAIRAGYKYLRKLL